MKPSERQRRVWTIAEKDINYDVVSYPYWNLAENFEKNGTAEEKAKLAELRKAVSAISCDVDALVNNMSADEFELFVKLYAVDPEELNNEIESLEKALLEEKNVVEVEKIQSEIDELKALKALYEENEAINLLFSTDDYTSLIAFYNEIVTKYN